MRGEVKYFFLLLVVFVSQKAQCAIREPSLCHNSFAKTAGNNGFKMTITPDQENYVPEDTYTGDEVSIVNAASLHHEQEKPTLNTEVNYSQENKSANLKRNRRQINLANNKHKIAIFQKDSTGSRNAGDLYIGTTGGLYLKYVGTHNIKKIQGINESVHLIHIDYDGGAFVTTSTGKLYYLNQNGDSKQGVQSYIPHPVLSIGVLQKKSSGTRNAGDIYIGTTQGVYLKFVATQTIKKITGIDEPVTAIDIHLNGGAYVTTSTGKLYYIDVNGDNKGIQSYIPGNVLSIGILEVVSTGSRQPGDVYIGTTDGLYLKYAGTRKIKKIKGIDEAVSGIYFDYDGGAYVITVAGKLYYVNQNGDYDPILQTFIPNRVLSIGVLKKNSVGSRRAGDIYIGTTEGLYLKYVGLPIIIKIIGIDEPVPEIFIDFNGAAYVVTSSGAIYYVNVNGDSVEGLQRYVPDKIL